MASARGGNSKPGRGAGRVPAPVPERPTLLRNRWYLVGLGAALLAAIAVIVVLVVRDSDSGGSDLDRQVAANQAASVEQDRTNLTSLSDTVMTSYPQLVQVLLDLHHAMPVDGSPVEEVTDEAWAAHAAALTQIADDFDSLPGGGSEYNVARNGFALGVDLLSDTVGVLTAGDTDLAFTLRDRALDAWATAATQLDVVTIDITGGHLHASLPIAPQGDEVPSTDEDH